MYPAEVEQVINEYEGVEESAVIGVPHEDFGEGVVAIIVAKKNINIDPDALIAFAKEKLANYKVPKAVILLEELPRNSMGKVQKNILRDTYKGLLQ